jgi:Ca2+-binding EF-hand superfamily protein
MVGLGIELSPAAFRLALQPCGPLVLSGERLITKAQFISLMEPYMRIRPSDALSEEELFKLKKLFSRLDVNGKGQIGPDEVKGLLDKMGKVLTTDEVKELLKRYDRRGAGSLNFDEFAEMLLVT